MVSASQIWRAPRATEIGLMFETSNLDSGLINGDSFSFHTWALNRVDDIYPGRVKYVLRQIHTLVLLLGSLPSNPRGLNIQYFELAQEESFDHWPQSGEPKSKSYLCQRGFFGAFS